MSDNIERRFVVVAKDDEGRIFAVISNSGRNGGEDNHTYKTMGGAQRRLRDKALEDNIVRAAIFEIKMDVVLDGQCEAGSRAVRAARRAGWT